MNWIRYNMSLHIKMLLFTFKFSRKITHTCFKNTLLDDNYFPNVHNQNHARRWPISASILLWNNNSVFATSVIPCSCYIDTRKANVTQFQPELIHSKVTIQEQNMQQEDRYNRVGSTRRNSSGEHASFTRTGKKLLNLKIIIVSVIELQLAQDSLSQKLNISLIYVFLIA